MKRWQKKKLLLIAQDKSECNSYFKCEIFAVECNHRSHCAIIAGPNWNVRTWLPTAASTLTGSFGSSLASGHRVCMQIEGSRRLNAN